MHGESLSSTGQINPGDSSNCSPGNVCCYLWLRGQELLVLLPSLWTGSRVCSNSGKLLLNIYITFKFLLGIVHVFITVRLGYKLMLTDVRAVVLRLLWLWETAQRIP